MPITPEELTRRIWDATPFIAWLGARVVQAGDDQAEMALDLRPEHTQQTGFAHGGVVGALADMTANLAWRESSLTVEYKVNFLAGAKGNALIARARLIKKGRSISVAEVHVFAAELGKETLVAMGSATLAPVAR